jgi:hypothetical protein
LLLLCSLTATAASIFSACRNRRRAAAKSHMKLHAVGSRAMLLAVGLLSHQDTCLLGYGCRSA